MKFQIFKNSIIAFTAVAAFSLFSCSNKQPYKIPYNYAGGYIIGKETCNTDTTKDYWLVDLSIPLDGKSYGDTLVFNGKTYYHVVKTLELNPELKTIGEKIFIGFKILTFPITTSDCNVNTPETYEIKVITVISQSELG